MTETNSFGFDDLALILRKLCKHPLPELSRDTYLDELPGMDSLRVLHTVALIEERSGVEIDVAMLGGLRQVRDLLDAVTAGEAAART